VKEQDGSFLEESLVMKKFLLLGASHALVGAAGFALGIYLLPILVAPPAPAQAELATLASAAQFRGEFKRALADSDALHWGEGALTVGPKTIALQGKLAPGPDYKLYLSPEFVETEARFKELKARMRQVGEVKTFDGFAVALPPDVDLAAYNTVIVWCESFGQFITAAKYR
jgi:Electron transfer DM13